MADVRTTRPALRQGLSLATGERHVLTLVPAVSRVRIVGMFFDLNKCFLLPSAVPGIKGIKAQYQKHPASNLLIVGHTNTSGAEDFNATLSVERADAMAAYLTDKVAPWQAFFDAGKPNEKRWGTPRDCSEKTSDDCSNLGILGSRRPSLSRAPDQRWSNVTRSSSDRDA